MTGLNSMGKRSPVSFLQNLTETVEATASGKWLSTRTSSCESERERSAVAERRGQSVCACSGVLVWFQASRAQS
jgi:hypothetical protein